VRRHQRGLWVGGGCALLHTHHAAQLLTALHVPLPLPHSSVSTLHSSTRTVRNACSEARGGGTQVFSVGTGGRGLLDQRLDVLAPQGHETLRGGARMTWLFRVWPGNVKH
jgi:hypothetical protein